MPQHLDLPFEVTGTELVYDAQEGRASSVTAVSVFQWDIGDNTTPESATTGSASIDSVNTTIDANSGVSSADPTLLNLAATSNIVLGRDYLITNALGKFEWPDMQAITSAASANSRSPLYNDYVSGDTLVGTRLSITIDSTWVADEGNISNGELHHPGWRVRWEYIVDSVTYVRTSYFDLVRVPAGHGVTSASIERLHAGWMNHLPRDHQEDQARAFIDEAYRQFRIDLYQEKIDDSAIRDRDIVDEFVMLKAFHMWAEDRIHFGGGEEISADRAKSAYWDRFSSIFKAPSEVKVPVAMDQSGAGAKTIAPGPTVR